MLDAIMLIHLMEKGLKIGNYDIINTLKVRLIIMLDAIMLIHLMEKGLKIGNYDIRNTLKVWLITLVA